MDGPEIIGLYYLKSIKLITQIRGYVGQCWRQRNVIFSASLGYSNCSPPFHLDLNLNLTPFRGLQWAKWRKRTGIFLDNLFYWPTPLPLPTPNHLGTKQDWQNFEWSWSWLSENMYFAWSILQSRPCVDVDVQLLFQANSSPRHWTCHCRCKGAPRQV